MNHDYALVNLSKAIVLPGLSRRTGKPCRVVSTRQLVVSIHHEEVALEGCLDPRGHGFRVGIREIRTVQRGLIEHAEFMGPRSHVMRRVLDLPTALDYGIGSESAAYYSLSTQDSVELIGGWGDAQGNVTVQMLPICGFLAPTEDPVVAPWRQLGHLWPNGQFARPSGAEVVSFVKQAGVVFAGLMPTSIVQDTEKRFAQTWGADWRPGAISEEALGMAEKIAQVSKPKKYVPVTPELLHLAAKKPLLHSAGVPWDYAPTNGYPGRKIWRNGLTREGMAVPPDDWAVAKFFTNREER